MKDNMLFSLISLYVLIVCPFLSMLLTKIGIFAKKEFVFKDNENHYIAYYFINVFAGVIASLVIIFIVVFVFNIIIGLFNK